MAFLYPFLGAALTVSGGDKLAGNKAYRGMFKELGWSKVDMQVTAAAEVAAGAMIMLPGTRRIGGAMLAATSAAVLMGEMNARKPELALPRAALLLAGLAALIAPGRTKPKVVYID